jgi:glyoxylase-like metal-dependent hydrolase (beta-lactamase superfamily II)
MSDEIRYPVEDPPAAGGMIDIAPGIKWLRMPLPIALDHINLYLVDASDGWLIVDTGMQLDVIKAHWEALFAGDALEGKPVKGVLVTHMHPDHVGLAGWLCERWRVPLYMSREEYFYARCSAKNYHHTFPQINIIRYRIKNNLIPKFPSNDIFG